MVDFQIRIVVGCKSLVVQSRNQERSHSGKAASVDGDTGSNPCLSAKYSQTKNKPRGLFFLSSFDWRAGLLYTQIRKGEEILPDFKRK